MAKQLQDTPATSCLLALESTRSLLAPIEASKKIKYTCIAASQSYVALGANTGGVYCFHRNGYKFIRILANKEGSVSLVRFSPAENNLAVCSGGGYVGLWELNPQEQGISKRLHVCSLLKDATVRDMIWDSRGGRVFLGDDSGRVAVAYLPKQQKLFKKPDELVLQEKAPIVQLDLHQEQLLVSTQSRCLVHNLITKETRQVGTRPRDGMFGACFHKRWSDKPPIVFSARPGGRLWQADVEGTVVSTLKLRDAVSMPASPILGVGFSPDYAHSSQSTLSSSSSLHFPRVLLLHNTYMIGWVNKELFLFEPAAYRLAAWTSDLGAILDLYCDGRQVFVLCEGEGCVDVRVVSFVSLETCVQWLVKLELMDQAAKVLEMHCAEVAQRMDSSDRVLYDSVHTVMASLTDPALSDPLLSLKTRLSELEEKFGQIIDKKVEKSVESNIEEPAKLENGFQTVDLMAYSDEQPTTEHVTTDVDSTDHVTCHVTSHEASADSQRDSSADFPLSFTLDNEPEPVLDSTLVAEDHHDNVDSTLGPDDLGDPLAVSDQIPVSQDESKAPAVVGDGRDDTTANQPVLSTAHLAAFHEELGKELPQEITRSQSQAIPSRVAPRAGRSLEGTPEYGTSVLSSSHSLTVSVSEPQSLENRSSLEPEAMQKKTTPDFANRVAAALSPHNDDLEVVAIPVKSSSGSAKEGGKSRSKKKGSRKKKSASSPVHTAGRRLSNPDHSDLVTVTPSPSRSFSLVHIPEETLIFPEAGLPPASHPPSPPASHPPSPPASHPPSPPAHTSHPSSYQNSAASSVNVSPHSSRPHSPPPTETIISSSEITQNGFDNGSQSGGSRPESFSDSSFLGGKSSSLLSKMKNIAKQGGVSLDSTTIQKQVKMVKGLLSSLANPPPPTQDTPSSLFHNDSFQHATPSATPLVEQGEMVLSPTTSPRPEVEEEVDGRPLLDPETVAFIDATHSAWQHLGDPNALCSPDMMTSSLRDWLSKLNSYREHLSILPEGTPVEREATNRDHSVFFSPRYLELEPAVRQTVSDMASLCLEMGCYGDDLSASEEMVEFVMKYYPILDMSRLRYLLSQQEWAVRVGVWKQLASSVDSGGTTLPELCSDDVTSRAVSYKLPAVMMRLYRQSPVVLVEACLSHFPHVSPWEVLVSSEIGQSEKQNQSCDEQAAVRSDCCVKYLNKMAESRKDELSSILCGDSALLIKSLSATLLAATQARNCEEEISLPLSVLLDMLTGSCACVRGAVLTEARNLCLTHSYWMGVVQLSVAMGDKRQALLVLLRLRDMSLFIDQQKGANLLKSLEDWQLLLELLSSTDIQLKDTPTSPSHTSGTPTESENTALDQLAHPVAPSPEESSQPRTSGEARSGPKDCLPREEHVKPKAELTWSGILRLMMGSLPPTLVLKLLSSYHGNGFGGILSKQLHGVLSQLAQIHTNQRALAHSLLERVDQYLWSPRPTAIGPQLLTVHNSEKPTEKSQDHPTSLMVTSVTPLSEWLEDAAAHWGIRTKSGTCCPVCRLSLLGTVSDLEPGVVALRCGHAFHKRCLPESACVECFASNMRELNVNNTD